MTIKVYSFKKNNIKIKSISSKTKNNRIFQKQQIKILLNLEKIAIVMKLTVWQLELKQTMLYQRVD